MASSTTCGSSALVVIAAGEGMGLALEEWRMSVAQVWQPHKYFGTRRAQTETEAQKSSVVAVMPYC